MVAGYTGDRPGPTCHDDSPRCRAGGGVLMSNVRRLPGPIADLWDWQRLGACRGRDSAQFFHPDGERGSSRNRREAKAKAVCGTCPVRAAVRRARPGGP